jgi:hypothetical protein
MIGNYDLLFADQELEIVLLEVEVDPTTPVYVARAQFWEGNFTEAANLAAGGPEPWGSLLAGAARIRAGADGKRVLLALAEDVWKEPRVRLWAWAALRKLGEKPSAVHKTELLGFIVEIPMKDSLDVLAVYADGAVRFLGHAGQVMLVEPGAEVMPEVAPAITKAYDLLSTPPSERPRPTEPPAPTKLRMWGLSPSGTHKVDLEWADVEEGGRYEAVFVEATKILAAMEQRQRGAALS